ncbi:hypothetical protein GALMADRAFT_217629 [Galerina marginata CBS 339.88]|uniref:Uncharacterized protein n=1 Tax=Galerina marginata (strain CBS 339.88) TaxID=685588 RepID=A0A067SBT7_GALM3|nr:hypothetical protein GALMADRAFT_217629 [Galerina marginata CBS 339.88]
MPRAQSKRGAKRPTNPVRNTTRAERYRRRNSGGSSDNDSSINQDRVSIEENTSSPTSSMIFNINKVESSAGVSSTEAEEIPASEGNSPASSSTFNLNEVESEAGTTEADEVPRTPPPLTPVAFSTPPTPSYATVSLPPSSPASREAEVVPTSQETERDLPIPTHEARQAAASVPVWEVDAIYRAKGTTYKFNPALIEEASATRERASATVWSKNDPFLTYWTSPYHVMPDRPEGGILPLGEMAEANLTQYGLFWAIREHIVRWSTRWGGVAAWPDVFEVQWEAVIETQDADVAQSWIKAIWQHADDGRDLLRRLEGLDRALPQDPYAIRLLWKHQTAAIQTLTEGCVIIDTRLGVLRKRLFALGLGHFELERLILDFVDRWNENPSAVDVDA